MGKIRERLTYANVMVTVLAFVVLGGTAWAVAKNSVGSKQLKTDAVHTKDIQDGAVTSEKVADGVIPVAPDTTVRETTQTVAMNCTESNFSPGFYIVNCSGQGTIRAACSAGERPTGGGYTTPTPGGGPAAAVATVYESRPDPLSGPDGWLVRVSAVGSNTGSSPGVPRPADPQVIAYAVCST